MLCVLLRSVLSFVVCCVVVGVSLCLFIVCVVCMCCLCEVYNYLYVVFVFVCVCCVLWLFRVCSLDTFRALCHCIAMAYAAPNKY